MNAGELRMPAAFAWFVFFVPGAVLVIASIIRLNADGLTVLGAVFLAVWAWLIGAFSSDFWVTDIPPTRPATVSRLDELDSRTLDSRRGTPVPPDPRRPQRRRAPGGL